jgi:exonuclease VII small subunit
MNLSTKSGSPRVAELRAAVASDLEWVESEIQPFTGFEEGTAPETIAGDIEQIMNVRAGLAARYEDIEALYADLEQRVEGAQDEIDRVDAEMTAEVERVEAEMTAEVERVVAAMRADADRVHAEYQEVLQLSSDVNLAIMEIDRFVESARPSDEKSRTSPRRAPPATKFGLIEGALTVLAGGLLTFGLTHLMQMIFDAIDAPTTESLDEALAETRSELETARASGDDAATAQLETIIAELERSRAAMDEGEKSMRMTKTIDEAAAAAREVADGLAREILDMVVTAPSVDGLSGDEVPVWLDIYRRLAAQLEALPEADPDDPYLTHRDDALGKVYFRIGELEARIDAREAAKASPRPARRKFADPAWAEAADHIADIAHAIGVTHAHPIALDLKAIVANVDAVTPEMRRWRAVVSRNITQRAVVEFDAPEGVDRWHLAEAIAAQVPADAWVGGEPSMGYVDQMEPVAITAIGEIGLAAAA